MIVIKQVDLHAHCVWDDMCALSMPVGIPSLQEAQFGGVEARERAE